MARDVRDIRPGLTRHEAHEAVPGETVFVEASTLRRATVDQIVTGASVALAISELTGVPLTPSDPTVSDDDRLREAYSAVQIKDPETGVYRPLTLPEMRTHRKRGEARAWIDVTFESGGAGLFSTFWRRVT